ncbi:hypothetical protein H9P43_001162 [Blastocladiella emersonii ATCC 22665]|nr:hypothetical protein H9P43_001162 [Blastocladiella emersonii ATCC 22665]
MASSIGSLLLSLTGGLLLIALVIASAWFVMWKLILSQIPLVREMAGLPPLPVSARPPRSKRERSAAQDSPPTLQLSRSTSRTALNLRDVAPAAPSGQPTDMAASIMPGTLKQSESMDALVNNAGTNGLVIEDDHFGDGSSPSSSRGSSGTPAAAAKPLKSILKQRGPRQQDS